MGSLIQRYSELAPELEIIGYLGGYKGLLLGSSVPVTPEVRAGRKRAPQARRQPDRQQPGQVDQSEDCLKRGLVKEGENPLEVAAKQLSKDGITILHTIGGDDTTTPPPRILAAFLKTHDYHLTVVGLPKTIDNDVFPIRQSLGALTAAEQGAILLRERRQRAFRQPAHADRARGDGSEFGWLTAYTAKVYRERLNHPDFLPSFNLARAHKDIDAVYIPELDFDLDGEAKRLSKVMDEQEIA
ncbi:MAG: 6-phosphofructokinase [Pseudomonadota bacterium]